MKTLLQFLLGLLFAASVSAEFRTWTRADGKTAELELISVSDADGTKSGEFKMRNGRTVTLKGSALNEADAKLLDEWKPEPTAPAPAASVFDGILDGNLVKLSGKSLKPLKNFKKPTKYYVFYYTASWCGPCQKFTPSLVDFYQKNKNDNFEIVLITSDQDEDAMEDYAAEKEMPWPMLKFKKAADFKKEFQHGVRGIPSVIVCDLEGNIVSPNGRDLDTLGKLVN
ncbi:MAG: thioredoxin-like domain-containing protein [Luteolibacter sp.]|nr:thioredoxin-like domain-containing protein [Luteolibacter sp.]